MRHAWQQTRSSEKSLDAKCPTWRHLAALPRWTPVAVLVGDVATEEDATGAARPDAVVLARGERRADSACLSTLGGLVIRR